MASNENTNVVHDWSTVMQSPLFTDGMAKETDAVKVYKVEAVKSNAAAADTVND